MLSRKSTQWRCCAGYPIGPRSRQRRKARGLPVLPREQVLPPLRSYQQIDPPRIPNETGETIDSSGQTHLRAKVAEFRVRQARHALEDTELRACPPTELRELEAAYKREVATYEAAHLAVVSLPPALQHGGQVGFDATL